LYRCSIVKRVVSVCIALTLAFTLGIAASGWDSAPALADAKPDLTIPDITISPLDPVTDDTVTITVTVKNQGTASAAGFRVVCYIDDAILATNLIDGLNAGTSATTAFTWKALPGSHIIQAIADSAGSVSETDETNNAMTFALTPLAPDLIIPSISWSPTSPSKGDSIVFTITVKNQGNAKSRTTRINFYIDGASRGFQDIFPIEPGSTTTRNYSWVAQTNQHIIKAVVDETNAMKESDETNNELTLTFSTEIPELVFQNVSWSPVNPSKYDNVTCNVTIKNLGGGRSNSCYLAYFLDGSLKSTTAVGALEPNASANVSVSWQTLLEQHEVEFSIDYYDQIIESDESNNDYTVNLATLVPDLIVSDVTWLPQNPGAGDNVTFTVKIKNQGSGRAVASRAGSYINYQFVSYMDIPQMDAGDEATATFSWSAASGSHPIYIIADFDNILNEKVTNNNDLTLSISILPPDLIIPSIGWSPEDPLINETVTFSANITNQGGGRAENFHVFYYMDDVLLGSELIPRVDAGASVSGTYNWKVVNGRHIFKAIANFNNYIIESDKTNNENSISFAPRLPDLAVTTITWSPADMPVGSEIVFAIDIENQGAISAGPSRVSYYIDSKVAGYSDIDRLNAGATVTEPFNWVVAAGSHEITIVADTNDQIFEIDENNNTKVVNIPLPDLIVTDITWSPPQASIGDNVTLTAIIKNQGSGPTQAFRLTGYIDGLPIAFTDLPEIGPGSSATGSIVWLTAPGTHDLRMLADTINQVIEIDETNNEKRTSFSTLTPDLLVSDIAWSMENSLMNDEVTILITVKNQGTDITLNSLLTFSIDETPAADADIPPIPAGGSFILTISPMLKSGSHTLDVAVDTGKLVIELDETNNERSLTFSTIAPDLIIKSISWSPQAAAGDNVTITVTVENQGKVKASKLRLDLKIDGSPPQYAEIEEINMGATVTRNFSWAAEVGPHEITALADIEGLLLESNEGNNTGSRTISLSEPAALDSGPVVNLSSPEDKGLMASFWWAFLLVAILLAGGAFALTLKSFLKK
jgi:subtilase family serine protease